MFRFIKSNINKFFKYLNSNNNIKKEVIKEGKNCFFCIEDRKVFFNYYEQTVGNWIVVFNNKVHVLDNIYRIALIEIGDGKNRSIKKNMYSNKRR